MNFSVQTSFMIFRVFIPLTILGLQLLLYVRTARWIRARFRENQRPLWIARALFLLFNAAALYAVYIRPQVSDFPQWFIYSGVYPYFIWHGATFFIGIVVLAVSLIKLPFKGAFWLLERFRPSRARVEAIRQKPAYQKFNASRRSFLRQSMYGLTAASFGGSAYGLVLGKTLYDITSAEFTIPNLSPSLAGFSIALVSDIHSSPFMSKRDMDEYVALVNGLKADMIVVDGDFVNSQVEEVYPFAEAFSNLRAPHGVYGVMGNHDFYNHDPELVAREVDACGVKLLRDDKTIIEKDGGQFYLVGVDDVGRANNSMIRLDEAVGYAPLEIPRILLCHRPYYLPQAAARNIDLVLSGHTHGGQVVLGRFGDIVLAPASIASRYISGKYNIGKTNMYISRGIGTVGLPIRLNCPPEITRITLVPPANA